MNDTTTAPLLEARDLVVSRDGTVVCSGVSLQVRPGECHGVIGPNGSGKSSLLLGLRGQLPVRGHLRLAGVAPHDQSRTWLARCVATVPQRMEFAFPFTVQEMVLLGRTPRRRPWQSFSAADRRVCGELLERLGIASLAGARVDTLSGGERRRVFLARALAQETPLLFLDEPTSSLDPAAQEELVALIRDLRGREGRGIVVVLHDLRMARSLCDRITSLLDGRQHREGQSSEVLQPELLRELYGVEWQSYAGPSDDRVLLPRREVSP